MNLNLVSDLHLEFGRLTPPKGDGVLVLAGDIHTGTKAIPFIEECLENFDKVFYVLGNHEFYGHEYHKVINAWGAVDIPGLHVLHNDTVTHEGVRFIGTTLWTPARNYGMNDYNLIGFNGKYLTPMNTAGFYIEAVKFLEQELAEPFEGETVVVTHHAPVPECVVPKYHGDMFNEFFHCHLNDLIVENDIAFWLHGHMHDNVYTMVGDTTIVCNPRGYDGYDLNPGFQNPMVLNLGK